MKHDLHISSINYESLVDGYGVRATIFISGCQHNCKGCFNKLTHDFTNGEPVTEQLINKINSKLDSKPFLNGITLSGGDPMFSPIATLNFLNSLHVPKDNIWLYSGFTYSEIQLDKNKKMLLSRVNVLVDGKFELENKSLIFPFRGSTNQKIILLK